MTLMKTLAGGIALILLIGFAGFFYRNLVERPDGLAEGACTLDAKICPDGSSVGRSGPSCEFAECAPPNTAFPDAGIAFVIPDGYTLRAGPAGDTEMIAVYEQQGTSTPRNTIFIHRYQIPAGQTADQVILERTRLQPADMAPENMSRFSPRIIGSRTFLTIVIERFEALVQSAYYLPRENDVLVFEVIEHDVTEWMEPGLIVDNLPEHKRLVKMLSTLDLVE